MKKLLRIHRNFIILIVGLLLLLAVVIGLNQRALAPSPATPAKSQFSDGQQVTIKGEAVCLPNRGNPDIETAGCAYGLLSSGLYYQLVDSSEGKYLFANFPTDGQVEVSGRYMPSQNNTYLDSGIITITSVKKL